MRPRPPHPLLAVVREALGHATPAERRSYLALLGRRLRALDAIARGAPPGALNGAGRRLARRILKGVEGRWDDGDENLIRGYLDGWVRPGQEALPAQAARLAEAARALATLGARRETLWFFLWEMESVLSGFKALSGKGKG